MKDYTKHNEYKQLAGYVYKTNNYKKPDSYFLLDKFENTENGFYAETFYNEDSIILAFRSTDKDKGLKEIIKDYNNNAQIFYRKLPDQLVDARDAYEQIKQKYPNKKIVLTGHSLGGSLAQALGAEINEETVTFGAFGLKDCLSPSFKYSDNITNYGHANDPIFKGNIYNQIGKTFVVDDTYTLNSMGLNKEISLDYHDPKSLGDLSKAKEFKPYQKTLVGGIKYEAKEAGDNKVLKARISKNVDFKLVDPNKIITTEEIKKMSNSEFLKKENYIKQQMRKGLVMPKAQAEIKLRPKISSGAKSSPSKGGSKGSGGKNYSSKDGHWVTIDGNHVFIED